MATGLPVIATRSGGPETIVNTANGILIDTENSEQLAEAMEDMVHKFNAQLLGAEDKEADPGSTMAKTAS